MILNFRPENVSPIQAGIELHSIRRDKHSRWRVGMSIQFSTGAHTKWYKKFRDDGICLGIQKVQMYQGSVGIMVLIDGKKLDWKELLLLARNDSFKTVNAMMRFFIAEVPLETNEMNEWHGKIIHWTDKKY